MRECEAPKGYPSDAPCTVCDRVAHDNVLEPRFGYTVCTNHADVAPTDIETARKAYVEERNA